MSVTNVNVTFGPIPKGSSARYEEGDIMTRPMDSVTRYQLGLGDSAGKLAPAGHWFTACQNVYSPISSFAGVLVASPPEDKVTTETIQSASFAGVLAVDNKSPRRWLAGQSLIIGPGLSANPAPNALYPCTTRHWDGDLVVLCLTVTNRMTLVNSVNIALADPSAADFLAELNTKRAINGLHPRMSEAFDVQDFIAKAREFVEFYPWTICPIVVAMVLAGEADILGVYDDLLARPVDGMSRSHIEQEREFVRVLLANCAAKGNRITGNAATKAREVARMQSVSFANGIVPVDLNGAGDAQIDGFIFANAFCAWYRRMIVSHKRAVSTETVNSNVFGQVLF